jgi:hypothetical protein
MEVPRHWRLKAQRYRLQGTACRVCGQATFPPRPVCPECASVPPSDRAVLSAIPLSVAWQSLPVSSENLQTVS